MPSLPEQPDTPLSSTFAPLTQSQGDFPGQQPVTSDSLGKSTENFGPPHPQEFLGKDFGSVISPWIITLDAL